MTTRPSLFRKRIAVPNEHGSWVLLLSPLVIGIHAGGQPQIATAYLVVAALAGFFMRQPILAIAKVRSGRRPASDLPAAWFWITVYGGLGALHVAGLVLRGFGEILYLAVPALPVAGWHAWLVMHRAERRQRLMEILAAGALALSAPAAMWIGKGGYDHHAWTLWMLTWGATATMIIHTYLRLEQRTWSTSHDVRARLHAARLALGLPAVLVLFVAFLAGEDSVSPWLLVPFGILLAEAWWGALRPATGQRPKHIGVRQLVVSIVVTLTFLLAWPG